MGGAYRWTELFDIYANCYKEIEAIPFDAAVFRHAATVSGLILTFATAGRGLESKCQNLQDH